MISREDQERFESMGSIVAEVANELEFLRWYYVTADFGPSHTDVVNALKEAFVEETGKALPPGYEVAG